MNQAAPLTGIPAAVCKITCGKELGTGFFVAPGLLITAFHVVFDHFEDAAVINVNHEAESWVGEAVAHDANLDVCLLKIARTEGDVLTLLAGRKQLNQACHLFGYPYHARATGLALTGKLVQVLDGERGDMLVGELNIEGHYDFGGLSGGPIIVDGNVAGVVQRQVDSRVAGISIQKIADFLRSNGVPVNEEELLYTVPPEFQADVESSPNNYTVAAAIHAALRSGGNWVLVHGSPGSGKSTLLASLKPAAPDVVFCGHYFTKIPGDRQPTALRTSPAFFLDTIEQLIAHILTGAHLPKEDLNQEQRLRRLGELIERLGAFYQKKGQTAVLVVDGLDEVRDLASFLGILPKTLPASIKIILSCTSPAILPADYRVLVHDDQRVEMQPLPAALQEAFIRNETQGLHLPIDIIQRLATKSEGHPLYMRYLVNYLLTHTFEGERDALDQWIASIPVIGGNISRYYETIWAGISEVPDQLWILLILAQLRQDVSEEELLAMLPEPYRLGFLSYFPRIRYLLSTAGDRVGLYHQSFGDFIQEKGALQRKTANDYVLTWCREHADKEYSATNWLFHLSQGTQPLGAVEFCDQTWVDRCAMFDVEPELVLEDIRAIIRLAADEKMTVDVIRLLLLLERIAFRYDIVFADHAAVLALSLISMGKHRQALRYLVRGHELQVPFGDANLFLQLLMEKGAMKEAKGLFEAIGVKYRRRLAEWLERQDGDFFELIHIWAESAIIAQGLSGNGGQIELRRISRRLMGMAASAMKGGNTDAADSIIYFIKIISSTTAGYAIRAYDKYTSPSQFAERSPQPLDESWTFVYARQILAFRSFQQYNTKIVSDFTLYRSLVDDTTAMLEEFGFEDIGDNQKEIIEALMPDCSRPDLLDPLIRGYLGSSTERGTIRQIEGAELDFTAVRELFFHHTCRGYADPEGDYPALPGMEDWEQCLIGLIRNIAFLEGRLYRNQMAGEVSGADVAKFKQLFQVLDFTLDIRSKWERGYAIPENLMPMIYEWFTRLLRRFFAAEISWFVQSIIGRCRHQMGLYTEGFRRCLQNVIEALLMGGTDGQMIKPLIEQHETHVLKAVQNRRERTPDLLRTVEFYGLVGETSKASGVYQEMLYTSMGPDWYKEAQFDLLDSVLGIRHGDASIFTYLQQFAGLMDFASGEMTFQSYIRSDKEAFAKGLVAKSFAATGMGYIQFELVPPPEVVIFNAEHFTADMPRLGDGYRLGGRDIREEYTVSRLLSLEMHALLRFALSAVFILNDDIDRFFPQVPRALCMSIQQMQEEGMDIMPLCRVVVGIATHEMMKTDRARFLSYFQNETSAEVLEALRAAFAEENIEQTLVGHEPVDQPESVSTASAGENAFERFNSACEGGNDQRDILLQNGFDAFRAEKLGLWVFNYSAASTLSRKHLKGLLQTDKDLWPHMKGHVDGYDADHWSVANTLIWFVQEVLGADEAAEVYRVVADHFSLIVRPEPEYLDKYVWLRADLPSLTTDDAVARFLVWLLGYPLDLYRERAKAMVAVVLRQEPSLILELLVAEIIALQPGPTGHLAADLLRDFTAEQPALAGEFLDAHTALQSGLAAVGHFSIRYILYEMSKNLRDAGHPSLFLNLEQAIPDQVETGMSVAFDEPQFTVIQKKIDELDGMGQLNGAFCRSMESLIRSYCAPLSLLDFIKADRYLWRSFEHQGKTHSKYRGLLHFALNMSITARVAKSNLDIVFKVINR